MSFRRLALTMMALTVVMGGVTAATVRALPLNLSEMAQTGAASRLEIRLAETMPGAGLREAVVSGSDRRIYLHPTPLATWADVTIARVTGQGNPTSVAVTFNSTAAARLASGTASRRPAPGVVSARRISSRLAAPVCAIALRFRGSALTVAAVTATITTVSAIIVNARRRKDM